MPNMDPDLLIFESDKEQQKVENLFNIGLDCDETRSIKEEKGLDCDLERIDGGIEMLETDRAPETAR